MEGKEVWPIKMTKSDFLDAKHISDYALNIYEASDADRGDLFLLCHQNFNLIDFFAFLTSTAISSNHKTVLKGVFSKPSGNRIVAPNPCFLS